jgi:hypothetical protein
VITTVTMKLSLICFTFSIQDMLFFGSH